MREQVLQAGHDNLADGGKDRTYLTLRSRFFWKHLYTDCVQYVRSCITCQQSKRPFAATKATLHLLPVNDIYDRWPPPSVRYWQ